MPMRSSSVQAEDHFWASQLGAQLEFSSLARVPCTKDGLAPHTPASWSMQNAKGLAAGRSQRIQGRFVGSKYMPQWHVVTKSPALVCCTTTCHGVHAGCLCC